MSPGGAAKPRRASALTQAGLDPVEGDHAEQEEEPDRHQHVPPGVELRIGDAVGRERHAHQ